MICPFVPFHMAKAESEAQFNVAESSNEQNGLSGLNENLMFHLLFFFVVAVTESLGFGRGDCKNKSNFLCTPVSLHP